MAAKELPQPRAWHWFEQGSLWFEWVFEDGWAARLELVPEERQLVVRQLAVIPAGRGVPSGGLSATTVRAIPFGTLEKSAAEAARLIVEETTAPSRALSLVGIDERNADRVIRPRGQPPPPPVLLAALASLYANDTRKGLAEKARCSDSTVKNYLERAREQGILGRGSRELTDTGRKLLDADRRPAEAIIAAWTERTSTPPPH